jgi:hypothetical protein
MPLPVADQRPAMRPLQLQVLQPSQQGSVSCPELVHSLHPLHNI